MVPPDGRSQASTLATSLRDPALVIDAEDRVLAWNAAAGRLLGLAPGGVGQTLAELGVADLAGASVLPIAVAASGSDAEAGEPAALLVWSAHTGAPAVDVELQKIRALARLAPGVNHQGLNQLAGFSSFFGMLRGDDAFVADYGEDLIRDLEDNAKQAPQLLSAFAELARVRQPAPAPQPLRTRIEQALVLFEYAMDVRRTVSIPADLPEVVADRSRLHQALVALFVNALDALGGRNARGSLVVTASVAPGPGPTPVVLVIEDDAATVASQDRAHLFDRVPPPGTTPRAGLDLSVARRLLEADGGSLTYEPGASGGNRLVARLATGVAAVESGGVERGAVEAAPSLEDDGPWPMPDAIQAADSITILVCDDDTAIRGLLTRMLERGSHRVLLASSASEALATLDRQRVDLVISDQAMADMSGVELYAAATRRHPPLRTRFVIMSGDPSTEELDAFVATTGLPVLGKPFSLAALGPIIRDLART